MGIVSVINQVLRFIFGLLQAPLAGLPSIVGVVLWSLLSAVGILLVYKRTSDQDGLGEVKRRIHAGLFEIRLFNDDLRAILKAQVEILRHNLTYLKLSVKPMIWVLPPMVIILGQLQFFYGYQALEPGQTTLLTARLANGWQAGDEASLPADPADGAGAAHGRPQLRLELPAGLELATDAVWTPALGEMSWRITANEPGDYQVRLVLGSKVATKRLQVTDRLVQVAPVRPGAGWLEQLAAPAEAPLPGSSPVERISVVYPEGKIWFGASFQSDIAWMVVYFIVTMVFAFALRSPLGVNI